MNQRRLLQCDPATRRVATSMVGGLEWEHTVEGHDVWMADTCQHMHFTQKAFSFIARLDLDALDSNIATAPSAKMCLAKGPLAQHLP